MTATAVERPEVNGTRGPHFAWWCREHLIQSIDQFAGQPLVTEDWQQEIADEALTVLHDLAYLWQSVVIVLPRKNGKTTLLAAYALYRLLHDDGQPEILLAASSDKQAGRLFDACAAFIRESEELSDELVVRAYIGEIERADGRGKIVRLSTDPKTLHGYNPSLVICDEVAQWVTPRLRRVWAALTTGGGARKRTQVFTISTAGEGHERADGILGRLVDGNEAEGDVERRGSLTISRNYVGQTLVFNFAARTTDPKDVAAIKAANPASWVTEAYLTRQAANPELTKAEFLQLHACVWAEGDRQYMPGDRWASLARPLAKLKRRDLIALGFDGSVLWDATALVACRLEDRLLVPLAVWERPFAAEDWQVPRGEVNDAIADAMRRYTVARGYFDPAFWQTDLERWHEDYGDPAVMAWPTSARSKMTAALERFRTDCQTVDEHGMTLVGHQGKATEYSRQLHRHMVNAQVVTSHSGMKLEKPGKRAEDRIDVAMAAILADTAACDAITAGALKPKRKLRIIR
ncbi:MAG: terminase large subunit [Solirubrobacteraceae bacterium]